MSTATVETAEVNMNLAKNPNLRNHEDWDDWEMRSGIEPYIETGALPPINYNGMPLFCSNLDKGTYILKDHILFYQEGEGCSLIDASSLGKTDEPIAVIIKSEVKHGKAKNDIYTVIKNGDEGSDQLNVGDLDDHPTISFDCLTRLVLDVKKDPTARQLNMLAIAIASGRIQILDYVPDTTKALTKPQKEQLTKHKRSPEKNQPPIAPLGFTLIDNKWHQAATVLFCDHESGKHFILGQDDGSYFGCELQGEPKTIDEAYVDLTPRETQKVKGVKRQGEWFAVPVNEKNVPKIEECVAFGENGICLPVQTADANHHEITSGDIRLNSSGQIYSHGGTVCHSTSEHPDMNMDENTWYTFYRNTAIRSVSAERNVD